MGPKKFYAVKNGRNIGIFNTWEECKNQVDGFKGSIYKSFLNTQDAEEFIGQKSNYEQKKYIESTSEEISQNPTSKEIFWKNKKAIYSDGGCNKLTKKYNNSAFGSVVDYKGQDLIEKHKFLFDDMELLEVELPMGIRTIVISKFNDCKTQQNNGAELLALICAFRIAGFYGTNIIDEIYCDSDLLVKYWSKNLKNDSRIKMDAEKAKYIDELIELHLNSDVKLTKISGDINLADLGFH